MIEPKKYPSIQTLDEYKQDENNPKPENIVWFAEEKIDGMNINIELQPPNVFYFGRERSELDEKYLNFLKSLIPRKKIIKVLPKNRICSIFGELYGKDIGVNAKHYSEEYQFRIFDVLIQSDETPSGFIWLERENVKDIANKLGIETPFKFDINLNFMDVKNILEGLYDRKSGLLMFKDKFIEGLVLRTNPLMLNRKYERIMFKVKKENV